MSVEGRARGRPLWLLHRRIQGGTGCSSLSPGLVGILRLDMARPLQILQDRSDPKMEMRIKEISDGSQLI